ncbi:hypothetical protein CSOJ01_07200, partial [Colletotrichum sojae]
MTTPANTLPTPLGPAALQVLGTPELLDHIAQNEDVPYGMKYGIADFLIFTGLTSLKLYGMQADLNLWLQTIAQMLGTSPGLYLSYLRTLQIFNSNEMLHSLGDGPVFADEEVHYAWPAVTPEVMPNLGRLTVSVWDENFYD